MQTDKELVELAAKAAGICLHKNTTDSFGNWGCDTTCNDCGSDTYGFNWNPGKDDGDSQRLQDALKISMEWQGFEMGEWYAYKWASDEARCIGFSNTDLKRAILLVAAAIGKKMP